MRNNAPTAPAAPVASAATTLLDQLLARLDKPIDPAEAVDALIRRMRAQNELIPLPLLEIMLTSGVLPSDNLAVFKWVQLAPDYLVAGSALHWNDGIQKLMLRTADGGWRLAEHALRLLLTGDQSASSGFQPRFHWRFVENDGDTGLHPQPSPPGHAPSRWAFERLAPELDTVLRCVAYERPQNGSPDPYRLEFYQVVDVWNRWQLWDRRHICRASFDRDIDAMNIADLAIVGLSETHAFIDCYDADPADDVDPADGVAPVDAGARCS